MMWIFEVFPHGLVPINWLFFEFTAHFLHPHSGDAGAVDTEIFKISICAQSRENGEKCPIITPFAEAAVNSLVRAVPFGKVCPGCATAGKPQHGIEHKPVVLRWSACLRPGDHILDPIPLAVPEFISPCCHTIALCFFFYSIAFWGLVQFVYMIWVFRYAPIYFLQISRDFCGRESQKSRPF